MSMELRDFLNWFEGFADNLGGKAPKPDQWAKIRERILALKAIADQAPTPAPAAVIVSRDPEVDANPGGTHTTEFWKGQVLKALTSDEIGLDDESAREIIRGDGFIVDLNLDPMTAARMAAGEMMN